ncbi:MAG UNVERIFIED_CONTAM: hypothetical protein LVQ98_04380 [Rickettsiaceae bacterium]
MMCLIGSMRILIPSQELSRLYPVLDTGSNAKNVIARNISDEAIYNIKMDCLEAKSFSKVTY